MSRHHTSPKSPKPAENFADRHVRRAQPPVRPPPRHARARSPIAPTVGSRPDRHRRAMTSIGRRWFHHWAPFRQAVSGPLADAASRSGSLLALVHDPGVLREPVRRAGADRVLLGSDFPFDMGTDDPLAALRAADLPDRDFHAIRAHNAAALLAPARVRDPRRPACPAC
ncbi:amidohydrolase family protein [Embleya sp. NPDC050154]|uniref:amidohydrolase family protein n=1 Tax=Embleya sp. NPDC050154 TaxID=3363988 RepID=UPI00379BCD0F